MPTVWSGHKLTDTILIDKIYSILYFEFSKEYKFHGESHNFWELVYVDKGTISVATDNEEYVLTQGDIIFHKPNEWHAFRANGVVAPNIAVISFSSPSEVMSFFENKILKINQNQKKIISKILSEYSNAFVTPINHQPTGKLVLKEAPALGSEQLLCQGICELLISLLRTSSVSRQQPLITENTSASLLTLLVNYMDSHLGENIQIKDLVTYSGSNKTTITKLFNDEFGMGPIDYYINMKIERAKLFLRESTYNITQISDVLGYSGIHYFSRQFKKITGMTPTEYSNSIKAMM